MNLDNFVKFRSNDDRDLFLIEVKCPSVDKVTESAVNQYLRRKVRLFETYRDAGELELNSIPSYVDEISTKDYQESIVNYILSDNISNVQNLVLTESVLNLMTDLNDQSKYYIYENEKFAQSYLFRKFVYENLANFLSVLSSRNYSEISEEMILSLVLCTDRSKFPSKKLETYSGCKKYVESLGRNYKK